MKALIIDDEYAARESIRIMGKWDSFGIDEILEAEDGKIALELIKADMPEIIITDMKMPRMDGVSLLCELESISVKSKIIVISGFSEFNYTQRAIRSKVSGYILKPVDAEEFNECLKKAVSEINQSKHISSDNKLFDIRQSAIRNEADNKNDIIQFSRSIDFGPDVDRYQIIIFKILNFESVVNGNYNGLPNLLYYSLEEIIVNTDLPWISSLSLRINEENKEFDSIAGLHKQDRNISRDEYVEKFKGLTKLIKEETDSDILISVGETVLSKEEIINSYETARSAVENANIYDPDVIFGDALNTNDKERVSMASYENTLVEAFTAMNSDLVNREIDELFLEIENKRDISYKDLKVLCMEFLFIIDKGLLNFSIESEKKYELINFNNLNHMDNVGVVRQWMKTVASNVLVLIADVRKNSPTGILGEIIEYINKNYEKKISLEILSHEFFVSEEYISRLFKKKLGNNFSSYLKSIRLKKSKDHILGSDETIKHIALQVGFVDECNFSKAFKKEFGVSPKEFRNSGFYF